MLVAVASPFALRSAIRWWREREQRRRSQVAFLEGTLAEHRAELARAQREILAAYAKLDQARREYARMSEEIGLVVLAAGGQVRLANNILDLRKAEVRARRWEDYARAEVVYDAITGGRR